MTETITENQNQIVKFDANQVISFDVTEAAIRAVEQKWAPEGIPSDLAVKENYELIRAGVAECRTLRGKVEAKRKEMKAGALAYGKMVDTAAKEITERLLAVETPIKEAKDAHDTAIELAKREKARKEEERVQGIADRIAGIRAKVEASISANSSTIKDYIDELYADSPDTWAAEFCDKALLAVAETTSKLEELYNMKLQSEQAAELAKAAEADRLAKEEADRKAREEETTRLAKENAAKQAELDKEKAEFEAEKAKFAEAKAEAEREEAAKENAARQAELDKEKAAFEAAKKEAEGKRLADEKKAAEELKKKAKKEVEKRKKEAMLCLEEYVDGETSLRIIDAIIAGEIKNVTFE